MAQIDRIRADLAAIAERHQATDLARQAARRRINEFAAAARAYYADEDDIDERVMEDLTAIATVLAQEQKKLQPGPLAEVYRFALDAMLEAARSR